MSAVDTGQVEYSYGDLLTMLRSVSKGAKNIAVVFSAGNGHFGFPGQHPDVISAGGTFMRQDGTFIASD